MARIRSVHPGLFTDEGFVSCSPLARLLIIGLWTEADDQGVFEWKPVTIKMRLLPADNADVVELLAELADLNIVRQYEIEGRQYGAIRNFRKFQRPKTPNAVHLIPDDFRNYVGLPPAISETADDDEPPFPQKGETGPQMEDGGGRMKEKGKGKKEDYAFEGRTIRLTRPDFNRWAKAYPNIDLTAELQALDDYYHRQGITDWFSRCSTALAKRNRAPPAEKEKSKSLSESIL